MRVQRTSRRTQHHLEAARESRGPVVMESCGVEGPVEKGKGCGSLSEEWCTNALRVSLSPSNQNG